MKYVAILCGVDGLEREVHSYAQNLDALDGWIKETLRRYPHGRVEVYEFKLVLTRCVSAVVSDEVVKLIAESIVRAS